MPKNTIIARRSMVNTQVETNKVLETHILAALESIPREEFVPEKLREVAYVDDDLPIGEGRFIMEPMIIAKLLKIAHIQKNEKVLVVASGSGYEVAVIAQLAQEVIGLENNINLISAAQASLKKIGIDNDNFVKADLHEGAERQKPFDVIFIVGAVEQIPDSLPKQLKNDGRIIALLPAHEKIEGPYYGTVVHKNGKVISESRFFQAFVPKLNEFNKKRGFNF